MKNEIRYMLDKTCELFNMIDNKIDIMKIAEADGELCNILKFELMSFLMCISACDGRISRVEAQLIREYFDLEIYPIHIKEMIHEHNLGSSEYYTQEPECLRLAVEIDNLMSKSGNIVDKGVSEIVIELFKVFGKEMVVADEKVKAEEQIAWSKYISMMTQYVLDHSTIYHQRPEIVQRPGTPIDVDYEISLNKVGRIYTLYKGKFEDI